MSFFENINLWAVLIAAIVKVIIGSFWYSPLILGKSWMHENGFTEEDFKKGHPNLADGPHVNFLCFCFCFGNGFFYHAAMEYDIGSRNGRNYFNCLDFSFEGKYNDLRELLT